MHVGLLCRCAAFMALGENSFDCQIQHEIHVCFKAMWLKEGKMCIPYRYLKMKVWFHILRFQVHGCLSSHPESELCAWREQAVLWLLKCPPYRHVPKNMVMLSPRHHLLYGIDQDWTLGTDALRSFSFQGRCLNPPHNTHLVMTHCHSFYGWLGMRKSAFRFGVRYLCF